jgi:hypothetical protein
MRIKRNDQLAAGKLITAVAGKVILKDLPYAIDRSAPPAAAELAK